jgi:hypothetical protein
MSVNKATRWSDSSLDINDSAADANDADDTEEEEESMLFPA